MFGVVFFAKAQSADSVKSAVKQNKAIAVFERSVGDQSWLYNGPAYVFLRDLKTNPNFDDAVATKDGSVVYYGYSYPNIPLIYDIERQLVVTAWKDSKSLFSLHSDKVSEFSLSGHKFIRLDGADSGLPGSGFYDLLYDGKIQVLARRTKRLHIVGGSISGDDIYEYHVRYYLKKGGRYYGIGSRGDMVDVLATHKKELKKFISDNDIKFTEGNMIHLATYYDSLPN